MKKIIRFTASWCGPCQSLSMNLASFETTVPIEVLDIDVFPEIAQEYGVRSVPTLVMLDENIEVKRVVGVKTTQELKEWIGQ